MEIQRNGENKVLPSLTPFVLIGSRDTISRPLWHNQYSSLVHPHACPLAYRPGVGMPEVIMRKLGDVAEHALRFNA